MGDFKPKMAKTITPLCLKEKRLEEKELREKDATIFYFLFFKILICY